jgi:hypothetical protein
MTRWTEFIKDFAKKNNMSYGCAMTDPKLKKEYYEKFPIKSKEQKKEQKAEDEEKSLKRTIKLSVKNFRDKYVKPHLKNPNDSMLKKDMIDKYRKFSQRLKDTIKDNAPKIYNIVNGLAEETDKRQEAKQPKKTKKQGTHKMPDGSVMTGKTHNKNSKLVKTEKPKPTPTLKKSLSPLEDIKNYLNDTNNENYKNFINNKDKKERLISLKKWLKVLKIKKENLLDSDIPYNVNNLFNENKLSEYQIFKDIKKRQKDKEFNLLQKIQKVLNPQQNAMTKAFTLKDEQKYKNIDINIKLNLKSEGLKSLLETVRINKLYEVFCKYYSNKQFKIKTKQTKEEIQQLNKELKKELQTYKSGLYFIGVGCAGAPQVPKALEKLYREKLNDSTGRKYGGKLYNLTSNINEIKKNGK